MYSFLSLTRAFLSHYSLTLLSLWLSISVQSFLKLMNVTFWTNCFLFVFFPQVWIGGGGPCGHGSILTLTNKTIFEFSPWQQNHYSQLPWEEIRDNKQCQKTVSVNFDSEAQRLILQNVWHRIPDGAHWTEENQRKWREYRKGVNKKQNRKLLII